MHDLRSECVQLAIGRVELPFYCVDLALPRVEV